MRRVLSEKQRETTLKEGLIEVKDKGLKLYSTGLDETEYVHYVKGVGFCYEDGAVISRGLPGTLEFFSNLKWAIENTWYFEE